MISSYTRGNEGGVLSEAGFSGWVGLGMEVVVRIEIWGIFGFRTIERPWASVGAGSHPRIGARGRVLRNAQCAVSRDRVAVTTNGFLGDKVLGFTRS